MSKQAIIQRVLRRNAAIITNLHENLLVAKTLKAFADSTNKPEAEYYFHNQVKAFKKLLRDYVAEQKFLKAQKGNV